MDSNADQALRAGGLPVLSTGLNLAELDLHGGEGLWPEVQRFTVRSQIDRQIDAVMGGRSAPRIWAFLESPGAGPAAAAAALAAAWTLAERGQMVVLVDADEQDPRITRWLGRTEQEGWIDMVRFGASLQAASAPVLSAGRRGSVLGVGTFAPTGITADEVADLVSRLRRQADDLILVLPAKLRSLPWIESAHIRLLCWDMLSRSTEDTERILAELDRMGARPDALMGFGVEEYTIIQGSLRELPKLSSPAAEESIAAEASGDAAPDETPDEAPGATYDETLDGPPDDTREEVPEEHEPVLSTAMGAMTTDDETFPTDVQQDGVAAAAVADRPRRRISAIPAVLAGVVISLVLLAFFMRTQLGWLGGAGDPIAVEESADLVVEPGGLDDIAVAPDDREVATGPQEIAPEPAVHDDQAAALEPSTEIQVEAAEAPLMDWSAYRREPGQDGWTLWLYSVSSAQGAASEVRRLEQLGIRAASRIVELPDLGRRWRIYAGSFSSHDEAQDAAASLLEELEHDWARPVRY